MAPQARNCAVESRTKKPSLSKGFLFLTFIFFFYYLLPQPALRTFSSGFFTSPLYLFLQSPSFVLKFDLLSLDPAQTIEGHWKIVRNTY
jgi:hypothetical protein